MNLKPSFSKFKNPIMNLNYFYEIETSMEFKKSLET